MVTTQIQTSGENAAGRKKNKRATKNVKRPAERIVEQMFGF